MSKMKILLLFLLVFGVCWAGFDIKVNKIGQWEVCLSNYGKFGQTMTGNAGAWWPRNSYYNYIFGAGIWVGTIAQDGDTLVTIGYLPSGAASEFVPGIPYSNFIDPKWQFYFSTDVDFPFNSISFEDGYAVFNDFNPNYHMPNDTEPIGITVTLKTYTFAKYWADDVLFMRYIIKNDTNWTITNLISGICMDYDITDGLNDRGGIDLPRKLFYGWQDQPEPGVGMLGYKLLSPYPLTCFKRFTFSFEPVNDNERYMAMAGYNFQNGNYEPFDTIWFPPDDQRILISSGIWNLSPGDSLILDWVLIASNDTMPPSPEMEYKADKAQILFNTGFHNVHIIQPNGGEVASGNYPILYSASSITPNPLLIDFYLVSEHSYDTIALNQNNTGNYSWNTTLFPDGVLNKIIICGYDTVIFGGDNSDGYFIINNPGNGIPYLKVLNPPKRYHPDTLRRDVDITWFARDPEFIDSLYINIYFKSRYDTSFQPIAINEPNDSHFIWNTLPLRNGLGLLIVETHDEEFTVAETIQVYLFNQISGGPVNPIQGLNNIVKFSCLVHQPEYITGHTYELKFLQYQRIKDGQFRNYPEYIYKITDLNTGNVVLDTYSLKNGFYYSNGVQFDDFSPIVDGFSIRAFTEQAGIINPTNYHNDSVKVITGGYPEDSIALWSPSDSLWWAYRGSRLQLDWVLKSNGGLTLLVTDLDYGDTIPYKPYGPISNPDSAYGWCFRPSSPGVPASDTLRPGYDRFIFLCGDRIRMLANGIFPQVGERWIVYPSRYSPPIKGNVYRFTPVNYTAEVKCQIVPVSFQVFPVPFKDNLSIIYAIGKSQKINLSIYDVLGRKVRCIKDGIEESGLYKIIWDGRDGLGRKVSSGIYFCKLETEDFKEIKKIIFIR